MHTHQFSILVVCFWLLFGQGQVLGCSYAYQLSLFPMGISGGDLIVLEVEMERYVFTPDQNMGMGRARNRFEGAPTSMSVRWKGDLRLFRINPKTQQRTELEKIGSYLDIDDMEYAEALAPYFLKAYETASQLPFFQPASLPNTGYCRYDSSCEWMRKEIDTTKAEMRVYTNLHPKQQTLVVFPEIIQQKFENLTKLDFSDLDKVASSSKVEYYKAWKPYAARIYEMGGEKYVFYTLGWGQKRFYNGTKSNQWEPINSSGIETFIEGNEVLFHGQRFDFFERLLE